MADRLADDHLSSALAGAHRSPPPEAPRRAVTPSDLDAARSLQRQGYGIEEIARRLWVAPSMLAERLGGWGR